LSAISVEGVSKLWGEARAVDRVSFAAPSGALLVLLGPSGCGKSTTLRLVAGLETADEGRIVIAGRDVTGLPPAARGIAMVFQSYALFPHLTVAENILFGLRVRKVVALERRRRLAKTAELLGLEALLQRKPSQLSGGQQQRVALARAIIAEAPLCLMDEPLSNLDAQLRHEMRREIRTLQQKLGMTMIYVTHDQNEAMSMADQVILLRDGRIEQDAPPAELYARPQTVFAARFIGTPPMNLVRLADDPHGAVIAGSAGPVLLAASGNGLVWGLRSQGANSRCRAPFFQRHDRHRAIHRPMPVDIPRVRRPRPVDGQGSVVERIDSEPRGACDRARSDALQTCIRLGPRGTRTMKQSFASAARLRGGGPIL
jgi:sn-glycerol 3-phosphate transport system ATP-binding protein